MGINIDEINSGYELLQIALESHRTGDEETFEASMKEAMHLMKAKEQWEVREKLITLFKYVLIVKNYPEDFLHPDNLHPIELHQKTLPLLFEPPRPHINKKWIDDNWGELLKEAVSWASIDFEKIIKDQTLTWKEVFEKDWRKVWKEQKKSIPA